MGMTTFVICSANNLSTRIKGKGKAQSQSLIERTKVNNTLIYLGIPLWKLWFTWVRFGWLTKELEGFPELLFATIIGLFLQMIFSSQWRKFSIEISNPGLFCVSQWDPPGMWPDNLVSYVQDKILTKGVSSVWFIIYKVLVTILMLSITSAHIAINLDRLGWKWIIFLTNQGLILIILHNILHLFLVLR